MNKDSEAFFYSFNYLDSFEGWFKPLFPNKGGTDFLDFFELKT